MRILYCINASIVEFMMLGRRTSDPVLRGLWDSRYGQLHYDGVIPSWVYGIAERMVVGDIMSRR